MIEMIGDLSRRSRFRKADDQIGLMLSVSINVSLSSQARATSFDTRDSRNCNQRVFVKQTNTQGTIGDCTLEEGVWDED